MVQGKGFEILDLSLTAVYDWRMPGMNGESRKCLDDGRCQSVSRERAVLGIIPPAISSSSNR